MKNLSKKANQKGTCINLHSLHHSENTGINYLNNENNNTVINSSENSALHAYNNTLSV